MGVFLNILISVIGFYYGVWFIKGKYLSYGRKMLLVFDSDIYNLDFLTGAGVALNTVFENKLDCDVKLALTKKILDNKKARESDE